MFPAYFATHRTWGPSYVADLHVGGDIMWVVGDTLMLWPMIPVALRWMHMDERRAVRIDRGARRAGTGRGHRRGRRARSAAEVHQLHPHPVRVGAVEELERGPTEVDGRPARLDDGTAELHHPGRRRPDVATRKERWVRPSWLTARRSRGAEGSRLLEGQELDGGRAPPDELRRHGHVGQVHETGELGADGVRLRPSRSRGRRSRSAATVRGRSTQMPKCEKIGAEVSSTPRSLPRVGPALLILRRLWA